MSSTYPRTCITIGARYGMAIMKELITVGAWGAMMTLTSWKNKGEGNVKSAEGSISTAEAQVECSRDVLTADPELGRETGARNQGRRHTHPAEGGGHSDEM